MSETPSMSGRATLLLLATAAVVTALVGCERTPMDVLLPNQPPTVNLSASPIRDSTNVFIATFNWNATDPDGEVVRFLYAVDDTSSADAWFTTEDFELTLFFTAPDSARPDTLREGTTVFERYLFNGAHTFYVKAVDDDGAESVVANISFTAETIAPETSITSPDPEGIRRLGNTFTVRWEGQDLDGTEPPVAYSYKLVQVDNILIYQPAEIEALLLEEDPNYPWSPFEPVQSAQFPGLEEGEYIFGVRALDQAGAVEPRLRDSRLVAKNHNVLLIRVVPDAGIPSLDVSSTVKTTRFPSGNIREKTFQVPANTQVLFAWEADASNYGGRIAGYSFGLDLLDLAEDNPDWSPESANLTQTRLEFNLPVGAQPEEHILYVRARDDVGTTIIADVNLVVVPLQFDRDVLLVDDWAEAERGRAYAEATFGAIDEPYCTSSATTTSDGRQGVIPDTLVTQGDVPHDICHDGHLRSMVLRALANVGRPEWTVDVYEPLKETGQVLTGDVIVDDDPLGERGYWILRGPVTLEQLARYKVVVWNTGSAGSSMLASMNTDGADNFLAVYLQAGGRVFLSGTGTFARTTLAPGVGIENYGYDPRDFTYRFLGMESFFEGVTCTDGCFRNSGASAQNQAQEGFEAASVVDSVLYDALGGQNGELNDARLRRWRAEGYPDELRAYREPYFNNASKGVPSCDAMVRPTGLAINTRLSLRGARLDTIYFYNTNKRLERPGRSFGALDGGATAFRFVGPGQGPLVMFGFPMFYILDEEIEATYTASIRWLLDPH